MELVLEETLGVVYNQKKCYMAFALDKEEYGISIEHVVEIMGLQAMTEAPEFSGFLKGSIKLKGKIIPVIDIRLGFDKDIKDCNDRTCIMVIKANDISLGLIVDNVAEIFWISEESMAPADNVSCEQIKYIKGISKVEDNTKFILDCNSLLNDFEIPDLGSAK